MGDKGKKRTICIMNNWSNVKEAPAGRMSGEWVVPDVFKVAVGGLRWLLLCRQVELFGKLPQSCTMKDSCLETESQPQTWVSICQSSVYTPPHNPEKRSHHPVSLCSDLVGKYFLLWVTVYNAKCSTCLRWLHVCMCSCSWVHNVPVFSFLPSAEKKWVSEVIKQNHKQHSELHLSCYCICSHSSNECVCILEDRVEYDRMTKKDLSKLPLSTFAAITRFICVNEYAGEFGVSLSAKPAVTFVCAHEHPCGSTSIHPPPLIYVTEAIAVEIHNFVYVFLSFAAYFVFCWATRAQRVKWTRIRPQGAITLTRSCSLHLYFMCCSEGLLAPTHTHTHTNHFPFLTRPPPSLLPKRTLQRPQLSVSTCVCVDMHV